MTDTTVPAASTQRGDARGRLTRARVGGLFDFPDPVNELAARAVAGGVLALAAATLLLSATAGDRWLWLSLALAYGFLARVATGPTLSPLGQLATRLIAPRLGKPRPVPGPPKRFAQAIGAVLTTTIVVFVILGQDRLAQALLAVLILFAALECVFGLCVGCRIFALLVRAQLIPADICQACADITVTHPQLPPPLEGSTVSRSAS